MMSSALTGVFAPALLCIRLGSLHTVHKNVNVNVEEIYIAPLLKYSEGVEVWITQFCLQITPYLTFYHCVTQPAIILSCIGSIKYDE